MTKVVIKKDYYRASELKDIFGFSFEDYLYLSEKHKNPIYFYVHFQRFLLAESLGWSGGLYGVASYRGMIRVESRDRTRLFRNRSILIRQCFLDSSEGLHSFERLSPDLTPNKLPQDWNVSEDDESEIPESSVRAYPLPSAYAAKSSSNTNVLEELTSAYKRQNSQTKDDLSLLRSIEDIVIPHEEAIWVKIMLFGGTWADYEIDEEQSGFLITSPSSKENLLHVTVRKLIRQYPKKAGAGMWTLIREGIESENDDIDPLSIFEEIGKDKLIWVGIDELEHSITRGAFKNLVSNLRKEIFK